MLNLDKGIRVKLELPLVNLKDATVEYEVIHGLAAAVAEQFGFEPLECDSEEEVCSALHKESGDQITFYFTYNKLSFFLGYQENLHISYDRFKKYFLYIQTYLLQHNHMLTGMGLNPNYRFDKNFNRDTISQHFCETGIVIGLDQAGKDDIQTYYNNFYQVMTVLFSNSLVATEDGFQYWYPGKELVVSTQPVCDIMAPAAFMLGIVVMDQEFKAALPKVVPINEMEDDDIRLQEIKFIRMVKEGLAKRGYGEEKYIECLTYRVMKLTNPAKEMAEGLEWGDSLDTYIRSYASL